MPYTTLFPGQEPNEKVVMILRRHIFNFLKILILYILLFALPIILQFFLENFTSVLNNETLRISLGLLSSVYCVFVLTFLFRAWLDHYLDLWVVTSERIVDIEQKGLFSRNISSQRLYRVQDVTASVKGIIPTFLHYGNVQVQTAGAKQNFIFKQIPNPYDVTRNIMRLVKVNKKKKAIQ